MSYQAYISSGAIEACILGVADATEQELYAQMRLQHSEVVEYANSFEEKLEASYLDNNTSVSEDVWQNISAKTNLATPTLDTNIAAPAGKVVQMSKKSAWWQYAAAACIALFLGSTIFNIMLMKQVKQQQAKIETIEKSNTAAVDAFAFLKNPDITPVAMNGVGYHAICRCSLYWDKKNNKAYFQIHHLVPPGEEKGYQLWAMVDGKPVSVGMVPFNQDKTPITIANVPEGASEFAVTLETAVGATTPNEDVFLKGIVKI